MTVATLKRVIFGIGLAGLLSATVHTNAAVVLGTTEVPLLRGLNAERLRSTTLGNVVADSLLWQAQSAGVGADVSIMNGGGIRASLPNNPPPGSPPTTYPAPIADVDVFSALPFSNTVTVVRDVSVAKFMLALENSVSLLPAAAGRFLQIGGFTYAYDPAAAVGNRVTDVTLGLSTHLVQNRVVVSSLVLDIAMNSFMSDGGDGYNMFMDLSVHDTGVLDRAALGNFIRDGLQGVVRSAMYPESGERIVHTFAFVPEPGSLALVLAGGLAAGAVHQRHRRPSTPRNRA